ncbi:hypothetical protein COMA2_30223 [Candidatus Nitrospira nitrificans]|uniref:Uncharacterized protein n=1 Tax=Candidatus Nitrospira nitrificans TaxID=1742973 RepID=A0A0S4LN24_9BACT|nr:hypothetical protein COMA2_30223 [Candidatus Nitrospira nitrificans]
MKTYLRESAEAFLTNIGVKDRNELRQVVGRVQ